MIHDKYYWVHVPTGNAGVATWSDWASDPSEREKYEILNNWNRMAMIGNKVPTYHYWM